MNICHTIVISYYHDDDQPVWCSGVQHCTTLLSPAADTDQRPGS